MHFNTHYRIATAGSHAFLSASKYAWIRYDEEKLEQAFAASLAAKRGSELHAFAAEAIRLGVKLQANGTTLSRYVNDAIGYRMKPEQILYYSDNSYGTADAISYRKGKLRIHDLKNGISPASFDQLLVYCALFFLEYQVQIQLTPFEVQMELRIYQNDNYEVAVADPGDVVHIMEQIKRFDKRISAMRLEAEGLL